MCTVTIVPTPGSHGRRIAANRDELLTRPPAIPPAVQAFGEHRAILPIDPPSGGTWIAVSDAGWMATLLNRNPGDMRRANYADRESRGTIIPSLLTLDSFDDVVDAASAIDAERFAPFRLVVADRDRVAQLIGEGDTIRQAVESLKGRPWLATSSGLGDHLVESPRRALFEERFVGDPTDWPKRQDAFHRHAWNDRPELSVCMTRSDAMSVSLTVVELAEDRVIMTYHPGLPSEPTEELTLTLPRAEVSRA